MTLHFSLPDGGTASVSVTNLLNAGYAGRSQELVQAHVQELAQLGIPGPSVTPTLYAVAPYLAQQTAFVPVQHSATYGEVEWAIIVGSGSELLITLASDHTDHDLEAHGIGWSKNVCPNVLATEAWRLEDVLHHLDHLTFSAWVSNDGVEESIQSGTFADLLPPAYWIDVLRTRQLLSPGTVLLSGTINMIPEVRKFGDAWRAELNDPVLDRTISLNYEVRAMPAPIR